LADARSDVRNGARTRVDIHDGTHDDNRADILVGTKGVDDTADAIAAGRAYVHSVDSSYPCSSHIEVQFRICASF
jgi:hypothetical protein